MNRRLKVSIAAAMVLVVVSILTVSLRNNTPEDKISVPMRRADIEFVQEASKRWRDTYVIIRGGPPVEELKKVVTILREHELKKEDILVLLGEPGQRSPDEKGEYWLYFLADSRLLSIHFDNEGKCCLISGE